MMQSHEASKESARIDALRRYDILDTPFEPQFDDLTELAAKLCDVPIALISLVDAHRQWFKSVRGLSVRETARDVAFCAHAIAENRTLIIPDATKDPRFASNPLVTQSPAIRFYAGAPLRTPDGHNLGTLCVIDTKPRSMDEPQLKALEALARQVVGQLELRQGICEITKAKAAADSATKAKSEFLANMSHEFRTPMSAILGYADLLYEQGDLGLAPPHRVEAINTIRRNGEHLLQLMNDLLDLARIEAGKLNIELIPCCLRELAQSVIDSMRHQAAEKNLSVHLECDESFPKSILTDPTRVRQVLNNLISNAIKFTSKGGVRVLLSFSTEPKPRILIDVHDTGAGISVSDIQRLFRPFEQADASMRRSHGGCGLGLSISRQLAEKLGGSLELVRSESNRGSQFRIQLPWMSPNHNGEPSASLSGLGTELGPGASQTPRLDGVRIALVEDSEVIRRLLETILRATGAQVTTVTNGDEAVKLLSKLKAFDQFDVVLMDMQMPVLDGFEATRQLRTAGFRRPIIALTAHALAGDRERCIEAGCDDYATKPIQKTDLVLLCRRWAAKRLSSQVPTAGTS